MKSKVGGWNHASSLPVIILLIVIVVSQNWMSMTAGQEDDTSGETETQLYDISEPFIEKPDGLEVTLTYKISSLQTEENIQVEIYDQGCRDNNGDTPYLVDTDNVLIPELSLKAPALVSTTRQAVPSSSSSSSSTAQNLELSITIDPDGIVNDSQIYNVDESVIRFCVRVMVFVDGTIEVNYVETVVTIDVDLTDGFAVEETRTAPKERLDKRAMFRGEVEGYFCDPSNQRLEERPGYSIAYTQGTRVRVCIVPTEETRRSGLGLSNIWSFEYQREFDQVDDLIQPVVERGLPATNALSEVSCTSDLCVIETLLFASYFQSLGPLRGEGIAILKIDGDLQFQEQQQRRRVAAEAMIRNAQESAPLDQFWNLTNPEFQYDTMNFELKYQVSDAMSSENVAVDLYNKGCALQGELVNDMNAVTYMTVTSAVPTGVGYGIQSVELSVGLDPTTVITEKKVYIESANSGFGQAQLCARISLFSLQGGEGPLEVNFWETPVVFNLDFQGNILLSYTVIPPSQAPLDELPGLESLIKLSETEGVYLLPEHAGTETDFGSGITWSSSSAISNPYTVGVLPLLLYLFYHI